MGGGGVDGAIHRAGGPMILEECKMIVARSGYCEPGQAVVTRAGNLPARFVIHTVGPIWRGGHHREREVLANCYFNSLSIALDHRCERISFPNISTGAYGFPKDLAARVAIDAVRNFLKMKSKPESIIFVCFDDDNFRLMQSTASVL